MASIASFSGLASGIDWQSMVDQIMKVESRPVTLYQNQISVAEEREAAWQSFRGKITTLESAAQDLADGSAFGTFQTSVTSLTTNGGTPLSASAGAGAIPGTYQARVLQLATNEKVGSDVFSSLTAALGVSGEFLVGGVAVSVDASDTLTDLVSAINRANTGSGASGVAASIVSKGVGQYQMVLTSVASGAEGISLADGAGGALEALGLVDSTTQVKQFTSNGARSDAFISSSQNVATLLGLARAPGAADVTLGTGSGNPFAVSLDLSTMSLADVAQAINTAAGLAGSSVTASVLSETDADGATSFRLQVSGTTGFTDANGILETLGIVERGRSSVAQVVRSESTFTDGDASTSATGATLLENLWLSGANAAVSVGDTLTLSGTRGDGTTFTKTYTVGAGDDLDDLLTSLNAATDGFGAGTRTATAAVVDGRLEVTDGTGGSSRLALSIVAHNQGGGTLDFGEFEVSAAGRAREIVAGVDAQLEVDGAFLTRSSNTVTDAIPGVTLTLLTASENTALIDVTRQNGAAVEAIQAFVASYNEIVKWVADQFSGAGAEDGGTNRPLSGDGVLRQMRASLRTAMQTQLSLAVGGDLSRLTAIGIEVDRDGLYQVDTTDLKAALNSDPQAVARLFGLHGAGSVSSLAYLGASDDTMSGSYAVEITQAATQGTVTGLGFAGTYVDDGVDDTLTIRDLGTGSEYSVSLSNGMTMSEIVSALTSEFGTPLVHQVQAAEALYADALGTTATDSTLLQDLYYYDGVSVYASSGVADGDVLTLSGTRADGTSFLEEFAVTDVTTQTLGDLRSAVAAAVGSSETVTWEGGLLTVTGQKTGRSSLSLTLSSDNAGGGSLTFGTMDTVTEGRGIGAITASEEGGELKLVHGSYGSATGFEITLTAGGTDGSATLGVAAGSYTGLDVTGTIGGFAATGQGQVLTGAADTDVAGLMLRYTGADTGSVGTATFSRGVASAMELATGLLLGTESGSIKAVLDGIDPLVERLNDRIDALEFRLERRREELIRRFAALEEALVKAQSQSQWIAAQFGALSASTQEQ